MGQFFLLLFRHGLTAVGFSEVFSDEEWKQLSGAVVLIAGLLWSAARKPEVRELLRKLLRLTPLSLVLIVFGVGCASSPISLHFEPIKGRKLAGAMYEGPEMVRLTKLEVDPQFYSRGCMYLKVDPDGKLTMIVQQDGTSDWIIGRSAPIVVQGIVTSALAFANAPAKVLMHLVGIEEEKPDAPSETHGCEEIPS